MPLMNDWHDYWRLLNLVICLHALWGLVRVWKMRDAPWNKRDTDAWYVLCLWTFTGLVSSIEGVAQDGELGVRVVLVSIGALVTHRLVFKKYKTT